LFLLISSPSFAQDVAAKAGEYMDATASVSHFNGNVLAAQDGKVVFVRSYGIADTEKNLPNVVNTKFRTGSITKMFTAAAVLGISALQGGEVQGRRLSKLNLHHTCFGSDSQ
jgi:CubicO group peptidase (beta-lactamase class C family)